VSQLQFAEIVADVGFDRLLADKERFRNFTVRAAMRQLAQHSELTLRQLLLGRPASH
jgi:hypothetical protein